MNITDCSLVNQMIVLQKRISPFTASLTLKQRLIHSTSNLPYQNYDKRSLSDLKSQAQDILKNYPLILDGECRRPSLYTPIPEWWPFLEKLVRPFKRYFYL